MSKELVYIAKHYMEVFGIPIRTGFINDIENLRFGRASQLDGVIQAKFKVADEQNAVLNSNDPLNAFYTRPFVFFSQELQQILTNQSDPRMPYALSIVIHECVHYLQPFNSDISQRITPPNLTIAQILNIPHEFDAYFIMAIYFFQITTLTLSTSEKTELIHKFLGDPMVAH